MWEQRGEAGERARRGRGNTAAGVPPNLPAGCVAIFVFAATLPFVGSSAGLRRRTLLCPRCRRNDVAQNPLLCGSATPLGNYMSFGVCERRGSSWHPFVRLTWSAGTRTRPGSRGATVPVHVLATLGAGQTGMCATVPPRRLSLPSLSRCSLQKFSFSESGRKNAPRILLIVCVNALSHPLSRHSECIADPTLAPPYPLISLSLIGAI